MVSPIFYALQNNLLEEAKGLEDELKKCRDKIKAVDLTMGELIKQEIKDERTEKRLKKKENKK